MLDVYVCGSCEEEFATKIAKEIMCCPFCLSEEIEFSHEVELNLEEVN